ncbi:hypothetical protein [Lapidilactobacillus salsurivasis]
MAIKNKRGNQWQRVLTCLAVGLLVFFSVLLMGTRRASLAQAAYNGTVTEMLKWVSGIVDETSTAAVNPNVTVKINVFAYDQVTGYQLVEEESSVITSASPGAAVSGGQVNEQLASLAAKHQLYALIFKGLPIAIGPDVVDRFYGEPLVSADQVATAFDHLKVIKPLEFAVYYGDQAQNAWYSQSTSATQAGKQALTLESTYQDMSGNPVFVGSEANLVPAQLEAIDSSRYLNFNSWALYSRGDLTLRRMEITSDDPDGVTYKFEFPSFKSGMLRKDKNVSVSETIQGKETTWQESFASWHKQYFLGMYDVTNATHVTVKSFYEHIVEYRDSQGQPLFVDNEQTKISIPVQDEGEHTDDPIIDVQPWLIYEKNGYTLRELNLEMVTTKTKHNIIYRFAADQVTKQTADASGQLSEATTMTMAEFKAAMAALHLSDADLNKMRLTYDKPSDPDPDPDPDPEPNPDPDPNPNPDPEPNPDPDPNPNPDPEPNPDPDPEDPENPGSDENGGGTTPTVPNPDANQPDHDAGGTAKLPAAGEQEWSPFWGVALLIGVVLWGILILRKHWHPRRP